MELEGWKFAWHALRRAVDMAVEADELREVLTRPKRTCHSRKYKNCWVMSNGRIALAVNPHEKVVITVLWDTFDADTNSLAYRFERGEVDDAELKRIRDKGE